MGHDWDIASRSLSKIMVSSNSDNEPVTINRGGNDLKCIGVGTDAAVFQSIYAPAYAFKLYAESKTYKIPIEKEIYEMIGDSLFFATCFHATNRYLVLSYEDGITLFDCLLQGIHIPGQVITDVENARQFLRQKGLNPRDIHLKNILLQNGRAKILDVSEYRQPGNDFRWEHLKRAYENYYHLIDGKPLPFWLLETIKKWYYKRKDYFSSYDDFAKHVLKLLNFVKKDA